MNNIRLAKELVKVAKSIVAIDTEKLVAEEKEFKKWVDEKRSNAPQNISERISIFGTERTNGPELTMSLLIAYPNSPKKKDIQEIVKYCNEVIKYGDKVASEFKQKWPHGTLNW